MNYITKVIVLNVLLVACLHAQEEVSSDADVVQQKDTTEKVLKSIVKTVQNHPWLVGFFATMPMHRSRRAPAIHLLSYGYATKALLEEFSKQLGYELNDEVDQEEPNRKRFYTFLRVAFLYAAEFVAAKNANII